MKSYRRFTGALGVLKITAPFPAEDYVDDPIMLTAVTRAKILAPQGKL